MRICFFSTYYAKEYPRFNKLREALKETDFGVFEIRAHGKNPLRYLKALLSLFIHRNKYDLIFANFRSQEVVPFMLLTGKPIVLDAFISMKQAIAQERLGLKKGSILEKLIGKIEAKIYNMTDVVLVDTKAHAEYFKKEYNLENVEYIYTGADRIFKPMKEFKNKRKLVLWYGSNQRLHGLEYTLGAIELLKNEPDIWFKIIINKKDGEVLKNWAKKEKIKNLSVSFLIPYQQLPKEIAKADVCLTGAFGESEKANLITTGKTYHCLAMKKATILADTKATHELFTNKEDCIIVKRGSKAELAEAICLLANDDKLREHIAAKGYELYLKEFDVENVKIKLKNLIGALNIKKR